MKPGQIWSIEYDCYVSHTFMPRKEKTIKVNISKCVIKISPFGFYELWLDGKYLRNLDFLGYLKYKNLVFEVEYPELNL